MALKPILNSRAKPPVQPDPEEIKFRPRNEQPEQEDNNIQETKQLEYS